MKALVVFVGVLAVVAGCATGNSVARISPDRSVNLAAQPAFSSLTRTSASLTASTALATTATPRSVGTLVDANAAYTDDVATNDEERGGGKGRSRDKYPGISIKNVAVQERIGFILKDLSAGQVDDLVNGHKDSKSSGAENTDQKKGVARPSLPNPVLKDTINKIAAKKDLILTPKSDGTSTRERASNGSSSKNHAGIHNPVRKDGDQRIKTKTSGIGLWE